MAEHRNALYFESPAAKASSDYLNSLPIEQRRMLAPVLEHYRQMGLAEAADTMRAGLAKVTERANQIKRTQPDLMAALEVSLAAVPSRDSQLPEEGTDA